MPILVHVTVSGLQDCACLNGRFTLQKASNEPYLWSSGKIEGCPGQTGPAFYKFVNDPKSPELGVTDLESSPGSGRSNVSPAETVSCSPLAITGGRPTAGNITAFCPKGVETGMRWVVEP